MILKGWRLVPQSESLASQLERLHKQMLGLDLAITHDAALVRRVSFTYRGYGNSVRVLAKGLVARKLPRTTPRIRLSRPGPPMPAERARTRMPRKGADSRLARCSTT